MKHGVRKMIIRTYTQWILLLTGFSSVTPNQLLSNENVSAAINFSFECSSGSSKCDYGGACYDNIKRCDGVNDCVDGSDELNCHHPQHTYPYESKRQSPIYLPYIQKNKTADVTQEQLFQCNNGQFIAKLALCDGKPDCYDKSDENHLVCRQNECPYGSFRCDYGGCINFNKKCDKVEDCFDGSDESLFACPHLYPSFYPSPPPHQYSHQNYFPDPLFRSTPEDTVFEKQKQISTCNQEEFQCDNGQCIAKIVMCNGKPDCEDKSDENNTTCGRNECSNEFFRCNYGACVNDWKRCNNDVDCEDGSDELTCCDPTSCHFEYATYFGPAIVVDALDNPTKKEIPCNNDQCRPTAKLAVCDGKSDCQDKSSEENISACGQNDQEEFLCNNGQCIAQEALCDGKIDCEDKSDETVLACEKNVCPNGKFRCNYGGCIDEIKICNGVQKCVDGLYAYVCSYTGHSLTASAQPEPNPFFTPAFLFAEKPDSKISTCSQEEFQCNSGQCITKTSLCDGKSDCEDKSDENVSTCGRNACPKSTFRCDNGACIDYKKICDKLNDCIDGSDESVSICSPAVVNNISLGDKQRQRILNCSQEEFQCNNGQCIANETLCDGKPDCEDRSDENFSACEQNECSSELFRCAYGACVANSKKCDGITNCIDASDEYYFLCISDIKINWPLFLSLEFKLRIHQDRFQQNQGRSQDWVTGGANITLGGANNFKYLGTPPHPPEPNSNSTPPRQNHT